MLHFDEILNGVVWVGNGIGVERWKKRKCHHSVQMHYFKHKIITAVTNMTNSCKNGSQYRTRSCSLHYKVMVI